MKYPEVGDHLIIKNTFFTKCRTTHFHKGEIVTVSGLKFDRNYLYIDQKHKKDILVLLPRENYDIIKGRVNKETIKVLYGN